MADEGKLSRQLLRVVEVGRGASVGALLVGGAECWIAWTAVGGRLPMLFSSFEDAKRAINDALDRNTKPLTAGRFSSLMPSIVTFGAVVDLSENSSDAVKLLAIDLHPLKQEKLYLLQRIGVGVLAEVYVNLAEARLTSRRILSSLRQNEDAATVRSRVKDHDPR